MIEDAELRSLFRIESEEHLHQLEEGLLRLEKDPTDQQTLEDVFRGAHSLKGGAGMLGLRDIERLAHGFEETLNAARQGKLRLSSEAIDQLCTQLDTMQQLVDEAVTTPARDTTRAVPTRPSADTDTSTPPVDTVLAIRAKVELEPLDQQAAGEVMPGDHLSAPGIMAASAHLEATIAAAEASRSSRAVGFETPSERYRIDTMRVEPQKLDTLMRLASELTVAKIRIARRVAQMEALTTLSEEWSRDIFTAQQAAAKARHRGGSRDGAAQEALLLQHDHHRAERLGALVKELSNAAYEDNARLESVVTALEEGIRTIRLLPLATIFNLFPRLVRDLAREQGKDVQLIIEGGETTADKRILEEMKDPLMHMIRNAIDHGIESPAERQDAGKPLAGCLRLRARLTPSNLVIEVSDDGRGLDLERIKRTALARRLRRDDELAGMSTPQIQALIFAPGFSTSPLVTDVSGRGVGLDVVRTNVERLKGTLQVESSSGRGCTLRAYLPRALAAARVLMVMAENKPYALPIEYVRTTRLVARRDIFPMEGRGTIVVDGEPVSLAHLSTLLELRPQASSGDAKGRQSADTEQTQPCIILDVGEGRLGLFVDALLDEQEVVVKPHSALLQRVRNISGVTILGTGEVCMVLNPLDLLHSVRKRPHSPRQESLPSVPQLPHVVLLVEDSVTTRTQEKRILESAGYEVVTAVNGIEALQKFNSQAFDAVISDVQMPYMDGLALTEHIRRDSKYNEIPIILVTSLASDEDKRRGVQVGANAYITKPTFDQQVLIETLRRLI